MTIKQLSILHYWAKKNGITKTKEWCEMKIKQHIKNNMEDER